MERTDEPCALGCVSRTVPERAVVAAGSPSTTMRWWGNVWASVDGNRDASMVARSACLNRSTLAFVLVESFGGGSPVSVRELNHQASSVVRPRRAGGGPSCPTARSGPPRPGPTNSRPAPRSASADGRRPGPRRTVTSTPSPSAASSTSAPAHPSHLAPPHPAHEEEPRDHRVDAAALERDLLGLAAAPARPVAGGEDVGQVRGPERPRLPPASTAGPAARSRSGGRRRTRHPAGGLPGLRRARPVAAPTVLRRPRPLQGEPGGAGTWWRRLPPHSRRPAPPPANSSTATPSTSCSWRSVPVRDRSPTC